MNTEPVGVHVPSFEKPMKKRIRQMLPVRILIGLYRAYIEEVILAAKIIGVITIVIGLLTVAEIGFNKFLNLVSDKYISYGDSVAIIGMSLIMLCLIGCFLSPIIGSVYESVRENMPKN